MVTIALCALWLKENFTFFLNVVQLDLYNRLMLYKTKTQSKQTTNRKVYNNYSIDPEGLLNKKKMIHLHSPF